MTLSADEFDELIRSLRHMSGVSYGNPNCGKAADELERLVEKCNKQAMILQKITGKSGPFICGVAGDKGADGLNERIYVCPEYGLDGFALYKKERDYSAPGW